MSDSNPLKQYFRQPAVYMRLPSQGRLWPQGSIDMPDNQELPVYPMTAVDEITYRTPDALFNGQAVVDVIQSCVPAIRQGWHCPVIDMNSILISIRIASYGHSMAFATVCPACQNEDDYDLDLRSVLDRMGVPDYSKSLQHGDLEISFRSLSYKEQNAINLKQFEHSRLVQAIPDSSLSEDEKMSRMSQVMKDITDLTIQALTGSIASIRTPSSIVTEPEYIRDFLANCDRSVFNHIKDTVIDLREQTEIPPLPIKCTACGNEYQQNINLDQANFFAPAS